MVHFSNSLLGGHRITIAEKGGKITALFFGAGDIAGGVRRRTAVIKEAERQLGEYFQGKRKVFQLPLAPEGTPFQQQVWEALLEIPYGETRSYKEIAARVGNEKACRAVGMANNRNPVCILIPCHRVIGSDGSLTGYAEGLDKKQFLLDLERQFSTVAAKEGPDLGRIREELLSMADEKYREFQIRLLPGAENYTGIRLPLLRRLAKRLVKEHGEDYLRASLPRNPQEELFEEIMLQGMAIGYLKAGISDVFSYTEQFLPKINNWSVCDSFCSGFKHVLSHREKTWDWLMGLLKSGQEFTIRFVVVMLLDYYVNEEYIKKLFPVFDSIRHPGYYVKMAVAWAVSACYAEYPGLTAGYLESNKLDDFTYRKALQKIGESKRT